MHMRPAKASKAIAVLKAAGYVRHRPSDTAGFVVMQHGDRIAVSHQFCVADASISTIEERNWIRSARLDSYARALQDAGYELEPRNNGKIVYAWGPNPNLEGLSDPMKVAIRTGRPDGRTNGIVLCSDRTYDALVHRGLVNLVNSHLTERGAEVLAHLDAVDDRSRKLLREVAEATTTEKAARPQPEEKPQSKVIREDVKYVIQCSEDGGNGWRAAVMPAFEKKDAALEAATDYGVRFPAKLFRVIEVRETWIVV